MSHRFRPAFFRRGSTPRIILSSVGLCLAPLLLGGALGLAQSKGGNGGLAAPRPKDIPADQAAPPSRDPKVTRGRYVAEAAGCMACHTAPGGKPYAGGEPLKSAYGTIYGANITPDKKTGIGDWSKADFERALRQGIDKEGTYIYPAMPYDAYTKMSADDMDALWAYMRTVTAVENKPPKNTLPFPLSVRQGLAVWQSLYFKPGEYVPQSAKSAQWNRGAYLVQALSHCSECHTPRNVAQGLEGEHLLSGAQISGWYAPDISNDSSSKISRWNTSELAHYLKTGTIGNVTAVGPMAESVHDSLRFLTDADLQAMAVYLKDQSQTVTPQPASKPRWPAERMADGRKVYEENCATCHQSDGAGRPGNVPALAGNGAVTAAEPFNIIMAMLEGFTAKGTWGPMASFAGSLTDDQIADVANYVRTAWGNGASPNATPWSVGNWRHLAEQHQDQSRELLCPNLAPEVLQPALDVQPDAVRKAATSPSAMTAVIGRYQAARPKAPASQVIEALSTAYCRAVAGDSVSEARLSAELSDFAQRVAVGLHVPEHKG